MRGRYAARSQGQVTGGPAPSDGAPHLYRRVAESLRQQIIDGTYPIGSRLPTESTLQERFGVSRHTVREALRQLREDNLVASRQGAGTEVISGSPSISYTHDVMAINDLSINDLVSWSTGKRFEIEKMEVVALDRALAERTGLPQGQRWLTVAGPGYEGESTAPACWAEYYIHADFAAVGRLLPRHSGPIFPLIEDLFGVRIVEVHQEIGATLVQGRLARVLKVKARSAGLEVRRAFRLPGGQVAQLTVTTHAASRHHHTVTLRRIKS